MRLAFFAETSLIAEDGSINIMQLASVQGGDFNWANPSIFSRKFSKLQLQEMRGLHAQKQIKWDLEHADVDPHMEEARLIAYDEGDSYVLYNVRTKMIIH